MSTNTGSFAAATGGAEGLLPFRLKRAKDFIESHLSEPVRLDDVAAAAGLSPFHFCRQFKRSTGLSPHRYLLSRRVVFAQRRLVESDVPLRLIAEELGFSGQSHFTAQFRRMTGLTPGLFRTLQKLEAIAIEPLISASQTA